MSFQLAEGVLLLSADARPLTQAIALCHQQLQRFARNVEGLSGSLLRFGISAGAAVAAGFAGAIKAAGDLEAQMITLGRVTGLSGAALDRLKDNLRDLAAQSPGVTLGELNKLAAEAARMGVGSEFKDPGDKVAAISQFTSALAKMKATFGDGIDLESTTANLVGLKNVFHLADGEVKNLASALIALDNSSKGSAQEILAISDRMAGLAAAFGQSPAKVMAWATAMRDVNVPVAAGSTALNHLIQRLAKDSPKIAAVLGIAGREMAEAMAKGPDEGAKLVLQRLAKLNPTDAVKALAALKMEGRLTGQILMQMAQGMGRLDDHLATASAQMAHATAIEDGYQRALKGTWAQLGMLGNRLAGMASAVGEMVLPAFAEFVGLIGDVVGTMAQGLGASAGDFTAWTGSLTDGLRGLRERWGEWRDWIVEMVGAVAAAIADLPLHLELMYERMLGFLSGMQVGWFNLGSAIRAAATIFVDAHEIMMAAMIDVLKLIPRLVGQLWRSISSGEGFDPSELVGNLREKLQNLRVQSVDFQSALADPEGHSDRRVRELEGELNRRAQGRADAMQARDKAEADRKAEAGKELPATGPKPAVGTERIGATKSDRDLGAFHGLVEMSRAITKNIFKEKGGDRQAEILAEQKQTNRLLADQTRAIERGGGDGGVGSIAVGL